MGVINLKWSPEEYEANPVHYDRILQELENFDSIPFITSDNLHNFRDGDLVRYHGMVQDILNPEYYYQSYAITNLETGINIDKSGKYRDVALLKDNEELNFTSVAPDERLVFFCIPIPGTSKWIQIHFKGTEEDNEEVKMAVDDDEEACQSKKRRMAETAPQTESSSIDKYFPLRERNGLPCLVKIYENEDRCNVVLNDRIEVIGFLSIHPALENTTAESDAEEKEMNPAPSVVPRLHSIYYRKLIHNNPLLDQNVNNNEIIASARETRNTLHHLLTKMLHGDSLAADYLICYLLSRIYARNDGQAIGKFSLNLFNIKADFYPHQIYDILENLVTNSLYLPLTIESLNEGSFVPQKNYDTNRLWSGKLQLSDDTHLVLDETGMAEGKLQHIGCLNVAALQNIIQNQEINYDFSYYNIKYNTNIPVLILSEGKSMFETDICLKLQPNLLEANPVVAASSLLQTGNVSHKIRKYLTCMRLQEFDTSKEQMDRIGKDYVEMRQQKTGVNSIDLQNLLVLSRLLALSYGRTSLTQEDWSLSLRMETERKNRLTSVS